MNINDVKNYINLEYNIVCKVEECIIPTEYTLIKAIKIITDNFYVIVPEQLFSTEDISCTIHNVMLKGAFIPDMRENANTRCVDNIDSMNRQIEELYNNIERQKEKMLNGIISYTYGDINITISEIR